MTGNSKGPFKPDKPPVLIQHGDMDDGANWMSYYYEGLPLQLQLAEAGYDVYIGNNRGTNHSQERTDGLKPEDKEFWNFTWADMGIYDDIANIKAVK